MTVELIPSWSATGMDPSSPSVCKGSKQRSQWMLGEEGGKSSSVEWDIWGG